MEFKELIVAFSAKYGIEGLDGADGVAELDVGGTRVEVLEDTHANGLLMYNLQWLVVRGSTSDIRHLTSDTRTSNH